MDKNDIILSLMSVAPGEIIRGIAARVKARRLEIALTQKELALRAGISLPAYRRFERTGEIALRSLVMLGTVLGTADDFSALFATQIYGSIDDLLKQNGKKRRRGKRNG